jgi:hypothetical protein
MTVIDTLGAMVGVWHDHLEAFTPAGEPVMWDEFGSSVGAYPYDNVVYVDFDGTDYVQTNVVFRGRDHHARTFSGTVRDGVLFFNHLGENAPQHVGVSAGPGRIIYCSQRLDHPGLLNYAEPDYVQLTSDHERERTYRAGEVVRTLRVTGVRLTTSTKRRHNLDPRGPGTEVHDGAVLTKAFTAGKDTEPDDD